MPSVYIWCARNWPFVSHLMSPNSLALALAMIWSMCRPSASRCFRCLGWMGSCPRASGAIRG
eukprot:10681680-Prorocentrum_lima.AAC.1